MVMGEVSLCRLEELPPIFARELRPALAKSDPAVLIVDRVRHESVVRPLAGTANLVERRCLLVVRDPRLATHRKVVIGALANRFQNVAKPTTRRRHRGWAAAAAV
jgi:hypothetical protein